MSAQTLCLSGEELDLLGNELTRLYTLQDQNLKSEDKAIFLEELSKQKIPFGALIAGIRSLVTDNLRDIKLSTILIASRKFLEPEEEVTGQRCRECLSGFVVMRDPEGRSYSLACCCPTGLLKDGLLRWNGEESQFSRDRLLTRRVA